MGRQSQLRLARASAQREQSQSAPTSLSPLCQRACILTPQCYPASKQSRVDTGKLLDAVRIKINVNLPMESRSKGSPHCQDNLAHRRTTLAIVCMLVFRRLLLFPQPQWCNKWLLKWKQSGDILLLFFNLCSLVTRRFRAPFHFSVINDLDFECSFSCSHFSQPFPRCWISRLCRLTGKSPPISVCNLLLVAQYISIGSIVFLSVPVGEQSRMKGRVK